MLSALRLWWICLLVVAMPFKAWALASGVHCGAADAGQSVVVMVMSDSDAEGCHHHEGDATDAVNATEATPADDTSPHEAGSTGHHSCSACAHCGSASTLPNAWISPTVEAAPHTLPASPTGTWRSAMVRHLDRPPTHGVI